MVSIHVPTRGTTKDIVTTRTEFDVSSHVPTRGTTSLHGIKRGKHMVSIHVPTRGTTAGSNKQPRRDPVSIHVPTRGTTQLADAVGCIRQFQSTFPRGERHYWLPICYIIITVSIHVPTRGTTISAELNGSTVLRFNPRSHEGNDIFSIGFTVADPCFNPRSHEGNESDLRNTQT